MTILGKPLQDFFIAYCFRDPNRPGIDPEVKKLIEEDKSNIKDCLTESIGFYMSRLSAVAALISFCYIVYAGYLMFTAFGDEAKYTQGKKTLLYAIIGFGISIMAWVIIHFFVSVLTNRPLGA
ncbi:MAG: pilin [Patescibacteria group bacterium]